MPTKALLTTLAACAALTAGSIDAATITTGVAWPTSPLAETVDVNSLATTGGRSVSATRKLRQTFQTDADIDLTSIILSAANYDGAISFTIKFFEVADIERDVAGTSDWLAGTQVGNTITVGTGTSQAGNTNLKITLSLAEQFTLVARNSGTQGYGMEIESVGNTPQVFNWRHALNTNYASGRFYNEDGTAQALANDLGLALVPEPGSLALLGLGGLLIGTRRRRD